MDLWMSTPMTFMIGLTIIACAIMIIGEVVSKD